MARNLSKSKGRSDNGPSFTKLIHHYFQSDEYAELSSRAVKLLIDCMCLYRGGNNGDISITFSTMQKVGWRSNDQLMKALVELLASGWLILTRKGGRKLAALYGLSMIGIDASPKLDSHIKPSPTPLNLWKRQNRHGIAIDESMAKRWAEIQKEKNLIVPPHG